MTATQQTSITTRQGSRLLLLAALGVTTAVSVTSGCQSIRQPMANSRSDTLEQSGETVVAAPRRAPPVVRSAIKSVGFVTEGENAIGAEGNQTNSEIAIGESPRSPSDTTAWAPAQALIRSAPPIIDESTAVAKQSSGLTLEAFESIALANNPTIAALVATTQKAAGFRDQVGFRANPTVGYNATQLADRGTDQHTVFISQTIITADKLALNRSVLNEALRAQLMELEAQKYRIATDIRVKFYAALAAQKRVNVIRDFQSVVDRGLELTELLKEAQEGSQLDVVQAKVQKNEIDLALRQAEVRFQAAWRELAALAGSPEMSSVPLRGEFPSQVEPLEWSTVAATMIASSPEYQAAQIRVRQARANLCRHEVQPVPNVNVNFAAGFDNGTESGLINLQIGTPLPIFHKNQGNIAAARADYVRASREVDRIENSIKARLAAVSSQYDSSLVAVDQYANEIVPNADEGLSLAEMAYNAGETSFVQVLVARRTYFDTNLQYIASQAELAQAQARVDGYVLTGALDAINDASGDDSLRGLTFSQQ